MNRLAIPRQNVLTATLMAALACQNLTACSGVNSTEKSVQVSDAGKPTDLAQTPLAAHNSMQGEAIDDYFRYWDVARSKGALGITKVQAYLMNRVIGYSRITYFLGPLAQVSAPRLALPETWNDLASEILYWPCLETGEPWPVIRTQGDVPLASIAVYSLEDRFGVGLQGALKQYEPFRPLENEFRPEAYSDQKIDLLCGRKADLLESVIHYYHWYYMKMPESPSQAFDALHLKMQQEPWEALLAVYPSIMAYKRPDDTAVALHLTGPGQPDVWLEVRMHPKRKSLTVRPAIPYGKAGLPAHIAQQLQEMVLWEDLSAHQWDYVEVPRLASAPERNENR